MLNERDARGVVTLTLNRPQQFNALSEEMMTALQAELDAVARDDQRRVVVLAGARQGVLPRARPQADEGQTRRSTTTDGCSRSARS